MPPGILPTSSRAIARQPNAAPMMEEISFHWAWYPTCTPKITPRMNTIRAWLPVRKTVSPTACSTPKIGCRMFGTTSPIAVVSEKTPFSVDMSRTTRLAISNLNAGTCRPSESRSPLPFSLSTIVLIAADGFAKSRRVSSHAAPSSPSAPAGVASTKSERQMSRRASSVIGCVYSAITS